MRTVQIKDLGRVITGHTPPTDKREYYGDYALFIKPTDIDIASKHTYSTEEGYSELAYEKYKSSLVPKGSTCVVCIGTLGEKITMAHCDCFTNQSMNSIVPNDAYDQEYVFYLLKKSLGKVKALNKGTASGREFVSKSTFLEMRVEVHEDISEQRRIGEILRKYDDLIEINRKQIKLLEEAAQRLYKEWFIDLRFPGHENTKIVDGVPEGWRTKCVGDILKKVERTIQIKTSEYMDDGSIPVIDQSKSFIAGYTNDTRAVVDTGCPVIIFGDHTRVLKYIQFPFAKGADGTQLLVSGDANIPQSLLYCGLRNIDLSNYHYARHFKYLKAELLLVPSQSVALEFNNLAEPFFRTVQKCREMMTRVEKGKELLIRRLFDDWQDKK